MFNHNRSRRTDPSLLRVRSCALITGASQGLGRALAEECADRNIDLLLVALPNSGLDEVARDLAWRYRIQVRTLEIDLTLPESPEAVHRWVLEQDLPVTILINNAGVGYNSRFEESTLGENERCILLNNLALVKLTRLLLPEMRRYARTHILNVASLAAFFPMPFMPVYAPSKAFILNFSLALRQEVQPCRVSVLCPNGIRTNTACQEKIEAGGLAAQLTCMDPDEVAAYAVRQMLAGKAVIIPGWLNRFLAAMARIAPRSAVYAVVSAFWGRSEAGGQKPEKIVAGRQSPVAGWRKAETGSQRIGLSMSGAEVVSVAD